MARRSTMSWSKKASILLSSSLRTGARSLSPLRRRSKNTAGGGKKSLGTVAFSELQDADLCVDAVYQGGRRGNAGDDPLAPLLTVSNQGGFRYKGNLEALELLVLT